MTRARAVACWQLLLSGLMLAGIWLALPARWPWIDVPGTLLALVALGCAVALGLGLRGAMRVARVVLWVELVIGTLLVSALAASAAQLAGSYGPVGAGGALLMTTIAVLVLPYLVVFPALQLRWLRGSS